MTKSTSTKTMKHTNQTPMPEIFKTMANKAMKDLNLIKAQFIVILPDGTTFDSGGDAIVLAGPAKRTKKTRLQHKMPHGSYSAAYKARIEAMKVGDVEVFTPTPEMAAAGVDTRDLQGIISTFAHGAWGNDAHKTHRNMASNCVELLRMA